MQNEVQNKDVADSSWQSRVNKLFEKDPVTSLPDPKLLFVAKCIFAGSISGFLIGGRIGARIGAVEHIETTQIEIYQSTAHAQRQYHGKVFLGFLRNGCRFGWRAGVFSGVYSLLTVVLNEVNTEYTGTNYLGAGALTGIIYKSLSGWRSMVVGAIIGSGLSLPVAGLAGLGGLIAPNRKDELLYGIVQTTQPAENLIIDDGMSETDVSTTDSLIGSLEYDLNNADLVLADVNTSDPVDN